MEERVKILKHHVEMIKRDHPPLGKAATEALSELKIVRLTNMYFKDTGERVYPFLREESTRDAFAKTLARAIGIINSGSFETMPEIDSETGRNNYDLICFSCGNLRNGECVFKIK